MGEWKLFEPVGNYASIRMKKIIIEAFERTGNSNHSGAGHTLGIVLQYCEENKIPYRLTAYPGMGYVIEKYTSMGKINME